MNVSGIRWTKEFYEHEVEFQDNYKGENEKISFDEILDIEEKKLKEKTHDNF